MNIEIDEGQRQLILLALAELSIARPGWVSALEQIALKMDNKTASGNPEMFETFRQITTAPVRAALTGEDIYDVLTQDQIQRSGS